MPTTCVVYGCTNTGDTGKQEGRVLTFYNFSSLAWKKELMDKWIAFVRKSRKGKDGTAWKPSPWSKICSDHFVGGKKSEHPSSLSYVPTILPVPRSASASGNKKRRVMRLHTENSSNATILKPFETMESESVANEGNFHAPTTARQFNSELTGCVTTAIKCEAQACLICSAKIAPEIAFTSLHASGIEDDEQKSLLALFCNCAGLDFSDLEMSSSEKSFDFCTSCSAYLMEWSAIQQDISKLNLRSSQVKATLLSRLLESATNTSHDTKTGDKINEANPKNQLGSQIRAFISKQFNVKVRLRDFKQTKFHEISKHPELESPTDEEETQESAMTSDESILSGPLKIKTQSLVRQEIMEDSDIVGRDVEDRFVSESTTQQGAPRPGTRRRIRVKNPASCCNKGTVDDEHYPPRLPGDFLSDRTVLTYVSGTKYLYKGKLPFTIREGKFQCRICLQDFRGDPIQAQKQLVDHCETRHRNALLDPLYSAGPPYNPKLYSVKPRTSPARPRKRVDLNATPAQTTSDISISRPSAGDLVQVKLECPEDNPEVQEVNSEPTHFNENATTAVDPLATSCPPTAPSSVVPTQRRRVLFIIRRKRVPYRIAILRRRSVPVPTPTAAQLQVPVLQKSAQALTGLGRTEAMSNLDPLDTSSWDPSVDPLPAHVSQVGSVEADTILPDISEIKTESPTELDGLI